jgi:hypothetical protein
MERAEELANVISDLKDSLGIPHFKTQLEDKMFCSAFLEKKQFLQDQEDSNPLRVAGNNLIQSLNLL